MALIEVHSGPAYPFKLHQCTLPARTKVTYVSSDYKTVTVTADEGTCFGPDTPMIMITAQYPLGTTQTVSGVLSADRKSFTFSSINDKLIESFNVIQGWTYQLELAEGYSGNGRFVMRYDVDHQSYEPQFISDYGYKMHPNYTFYAYLYADYEDTTPAVSVNIDMWPDGKRVGWPYDIDGAWPSAWEGYKKIVMELATVANGNEPLSATITNNTQHTSYIIRSFWDSVNEVWFPVMEVNFDQFWYPRSTFQILVNNVAQTYELDGDFYYTRRCKASMAITSLINPITISGDVYHREWPYVENPEAQPDEDKVIYTCPPGSRIAYEYSDGAYHDMLWIPVNNVKHWFTVNETKTSGVLDLAFYEATYETVWLNARTVYGQFDQIPTGNVSMVYNLSHCSVQGTAPSTLALDGHLQLTLVADNGYQFNTAPTLRYYDDWDNAVNVSATVSQDKLTATFDWYPYAVNLSPDYPNNANFLITGTAAAIPAPPFSATIVNNISGTTYTQTNDNINVYAPTGYVFSAAPTLEWTDGTNSGTANFTMAADGKSAVISATAWRTSAYTLTIQGAIEQEHTWGPSSITNNVAHTTQSLSGTTLTLVCDNGYAFDAAPVIAQAGGAGPITMTLNSSGTIASADITAYDELAVVISGSTSLIPEPPTPSTNHTVYTRLTNCTGSGIPGVVDEDDVLSITLTANTGYEFDNNYKPALEYIKTDNLTYSELFTIAADGLSATLTISMAGLGLKEDSAITIVGQAYETEPTPPGPEPSIEDKYGMVNIYHVSSSELATFASRRFQYDQNMNVFDDWGNYVTSLRRVFVTIATETVSAIKCGRYNTNISSHTPSSDTVTLNFGSVTIPAHNLDITDYSSKVQIFLPFIGFRDISAEYAGKTLSLTYEINIVTGEGVAKLTCNSNVVYLYECAPSSDMAYKTNTMVSQTLGGSNFNTKYMYGLVPYVLVKWYSNRNEHLVNNDCDRVIIGNFQGYAKFIEVTDINNSQITAEEKNLLLRTLAGGVYIEDEQD